MKINKKFLIISAISLVIVIIIIAVVFAKKSASVISGNKSQTTVSLSNVQAQSYAANQVPVWRSADKAFGSADAKLKIFVYEDYTNIYSAELADTLNKIITEFGGQVAIITRPYFKNSSLAAAAATAIDCAGAQKKWAEMRAVLFARVKSGRFMTADFSADAQQIGLDLSSFNNCLTNNQKSGKIEQDPVATTIQGAPTMFVGNEMILGARPYDNYVDSNGDKIEGLKQVVARKIGQ